VLRVQVPIEERHLPTPKVGHRRPAEPMALVGVTQQRHVHARAAHTVVPCSNVIRSSAPYSRTVPRTTTSSHHKEKLPGGPAGMNVAMRLSGVPKRVTATDIYFQLSGTYPVKKLGRVLHQAFARTDVMHDDRVCHLNALRQVPGVEGRNRLLEKRSIERQRAVKIDNP
jgi:hypothetical protein